MKGVLCDRRLWIAAVWCLLGWACVALLAHGQAQAGESVAIPPSAPSKTGFGGRADARLLEPSPLTDTVRLYGYVTDLVTGLAIPGAYVEAKDESYAVLASMGADSAGFYDLSVPWRSVYIVCASDWGPNGDYWLQAHIFVCRRVSSAGAVEIQTDLALPPAGNLIVAAYDDNGDLVRNAAFASATDGYAFVTDLDGLPHAGLLSGVHDPYSQGHNWDWALAVPAFVVPTQTLNSLHVLWTVPAFGRVILEVDNSGPGYAAPSPGDYLVLNFNHEAARSEVARLEHELDLFTSQGYAISTTVEAKLALAEAAVAAGEAHLNAVPPEMAAAVQDFDEALAHALFAQEILYLDKAGADIPRYRQGALTLSLRYAGGEPIAGAVVTYRQQTHDFLFSTGYLTTDGWNYDPQLGDLLEQMGANGASVMLEHAVFEPEPGVYDWTFLDQHSGLNPLLGKGWRIMGALAYYGSSGQAFDCPAYWNSMTFDQYKQHLFNHFQAVASRYGTRINPWMINEQNLPWSNCLGLTWEQKFEVFQTVMAGLQAGYAEAENLVTSLALPYGWEQKAAPPDLNTQAEGVSFPLYLAWLAERGLAVHNIGLEFHFFGVAVPPGSYAFPGMTLASLARLMDRYDSYGVPIWIEPFQVPSQQEPGSAWWHRPWDQATQAEFAVKFYTLAFSRQNMHDVCWSDASDHAPFVIGGGLIDSSYQPKQAYYALRDLIASWTTSEVGITDGNGALEMAGFAGDYTVTITLPGGNDFQSELHIYEQRQTEVTITIHQVYLPLVLKTAIGSGNWRP
jgi:hypothetical protein